MYEDFVPERLAKLRTQKGVSARDMSLSLGQANNYINNIENKKSLPAMQSFFYICEYLGVTPQEFFDEGNTYPETLKEFIAEARQLDPQSMQYILGIMKEPQFNYAWLPFWASITLAVGMFIGNWNSNSSEYQLYDTYDYEYARRNNFNMLLHIIEQQYVDSVNSKELTDNAMTSILKELDPHSAYIPAEDLESVNEELEGSFSGIGIQFNLLNDTINVVDVISGGPSERCGLMPGDRIITVDDSLYVGKNITNEKVMKNLRGAKGSVVKLGIQRKGESELLTFEVERGDIPLHSVDASFIISPGIGYILVSKFGRTTFEEFL